jgi:transglutaminase-like putative cysteine protease
LARTALLFVGPAILLGISWYGLETGDREGITAAGMALLALLPALAPTWRTRVATAVLVTLVALSRAFEVGFSLGFLGDVAGDLKQGVLAFYDVSLPFRAGEEPLMHGAVLTAIFAFCLVVSLGLAARRPLVAAFGLVAGAAWPATLVGSGNRIGFGAVILAVVLSLLAWGGRRPASSPRPALLAGAALVLAAVAAGAQPAVAKGEFLGWKGWDPYDEPADPVGVDYVWDASYDGIEFPSEPTDVLTITGPRRAQYWRAGVLNEFRNGRWVEAPSIIAIGDGAQDLSNDPLLPVRARTISRPVRAEVEVEALRDDHLVAPGTPVALDPRGIGTVEYRDGNVAVVDGGLERGDEYTVWSYVPTPRPRQLAAVPIAPDRRNTLLSNYLDVLPGYEVPPLGSEDRQRRVFSLTENEEVGDTVRGYLPLYRRAQAVTQGARTQYAIVVALESWFRSDGGFRYTESPPKLRTGAPPLVDFVERTKAGYCQHYAGAMALMLRYLGIPARVAVGFTSGDYDEDNRRWTVTDHDAHAWVEVWFDGWGWLPFDPTPTRGAGANPYSTASSNPAVQTAIRDLLRQELRRNVAPSGPAEGTQVGGRDVPGDLGGTVSAAARKGGSLLKLLGALAVLVLVAVALAKLARRRVRYVTRDPRRVARAVRAELAEYLLDQGLPVPRSATPHELAELLHRELRIDASTFADALAAARYAPPDRAADASRDARRELRSIERLLRKRLTNAERARGFLSVRSLGFGATA